MANSGQNNGVTGILDLKTAATYPPIQVYILGFALALAAELTKTTGPGDAFDDRYYAGNVGGSGSANGKIQSNQSPFPPTLHNLQGTLTHQADAGCTVAIPVIIEVITCTKKTADQETWIVEAKWRKNGAAVANWNGTTVTYSQPSLSNKEINEGTQRAIDPNSLGTAATTKTFLPTPASGSNSGYTQFATLAAITAYNAGAVAPAANLKIVSSAFLRIDDAAGILLTQWALNDTKDSYQLPVTDTMLDPGSLGSFAHIATINGSSLTLTNFALRGSTTKNVTPGSTLTVAEFGLLTTTESLTFPGTFTELDANDLITKGVNTYVGNDTAHTYSPVSGLKTRTRTPTQLTSTLGTLNQYKIVTEFGKLDSKDELILPRARSVVDVNSLNSFATAAAIDSTPATPSGYKLRDIITENPTPDHTLVEVRGGLRSHADDLLFPATKSFRSAQSPYMDYAAQLVAASGDIATQANTLWAAFQSVNYALGLWLYPRTDGLRKVVYIYRNPGIMFRGASGGGERLVMSKLNGTNPQVYVVSNLSLGSGWRQVRLSRVTVHDSTFREFSITRLITGTTIPEAYPSTINSVELPHKGDILLNGSNSFLGLADSTCQYKGPAYRTNLSLSGTLPFFMRYTLKQDDQGFAQGLPERYFHEPQYFNTSATNLGWTNVSTLNIPDVSVPGGHHFQAFVA